MAAKHRDKNICVPTADLCKMNCTVCRQQTECLTDGMMKRCTLKEEVYHHMHERVRCKECLLTCKKCTHDTDGQPGHTQGLG